jgi:peptide/nickel transport system permease protein
MASYVLRRLLGAIPLVLGVATILFFVLSLAPGDPVSLFAGPNVSPEALEAIRRNLGLDRPVGERYLRWLGALLQGDLGNSITRGQPVAQIMAEIIPNTLILASTALVLSFLVGVALGIIQAVRQYTAADSILSVIALFFYSMPAFWLALMLILFFSLFARNVWDWPFFLPASGMTSVGHSFMTPMEQLKDRAMHLILPAVSLTLVLSAGIARYMRGSMLEVVRQDYIRTARAKGLGEFRVIFRHALRNALIPIVTLVGLYLPILFSGTVYIEWVFAWPGMGKTIVDAILQRDIPVVMATSLFFAIMVVIGNLVADILYAVVDPRIRYE